MSAAGAGLARASGALLTGLVLGELLAPRIGHRAARIAVIVIAYLGGAAALIDGSVCWNDRGRTRVASGRTSPIESRRRPDMLAR